MRFVTTNTEPFSLILGYVEYFPIQPQSPADVAQEMMKAEMTRTLLKWKM